MVDLDNVASPWHTIVEVRAVDRTGLLNRVAAALARAGAQIHTATVATVDGVAVDTFLVTGPDGHKLDESGERALRIAFQGGTPGKRRGGPHRAEKRRTPTKHPRHRDKKIEPPEPLDPPGKAQTKRGGYLAWEGRRRGE